MGQDSGRIIISEEQVASALDMRGAIDAVERGLAAQAHGEAVNMLKTHTAWDGSTLHAIGAVFPKVGLAGTKTWAHTPRGASPLLILFDAENGGVRAIIDAFNLGKFRTAAASGVATRRLAREDADDLAIIGTGKQAFTQVEAVCAVRRIRRIRVFSPNEQHRTEFAAVLKKRFDAEIIASPSVHDAVRGASIITTITRAREPFLHAAMIERGAHINAVGAILPSRAELSSDVVERCTQIVSDSPAQAEKLSHELIGALGSDPQKWNAVGFLGELVTSEGRRRSADDLTLLKSLGTGVLDLSVGIEVYRRIVPLGEGTVPK
ncbi:MAG: ornithine cyclodeaminase [Acidobacteria bacterium]|nr:MAG: ornithine cyclodeaminase [Acidobacteriota bacterium]